MSLLLLAAAGCASGNEEAIAQTKEAMITPPVGCLTETLCNSAASCTVGSVLNSTPGFPINFTFDPLANYGPNPTCQGFYVVELDNPSALTSPNDAVITVKPSFSTASQCVPGSTLSVSVFGHAAGTWAPLAGLSDQETSVFLQGQCAIDTITESLGAQSQYDQLRVVMNGTDPTGAEFPLSVNVTGCAPRSCSRFSCGRVLDGCGGVLNCRRCGRR